MDRLANYQQQKIIKPLQQQTQQLLLQKQQLEQQQMQLHHQQMLHQQSLQQQHKKPTIDPQMYTYKPEKNYRKYKQQQHQPLQQQRSQLYHSHKPPTSLKSESIVF